MSVNKLGRFENVIVSYRSTSLGEELLLLDTNKKDQVFLYGSVKIKNLIAFLNECHVQRKEEIKLKEEKKSCSILKT